MVIKRDNEIIQMDGEYLQNVYIAQRQKLYGVEENI